MYYTAVFLGGEWGLVDFTTVGKIYCVFLCVMGIAIWSVPIGTLFEGFETIINPDTKENRAIQAAKKKLAEKEAELVKEAAKATGNSKQPLAKTQELSNVAK